MTNKYLKTFSKLLLYPLAAVIASCAASDDEVKGSVYCNINLTETYQVGTNPSTDFNVTNLPKNTVFNQADCPDINTDSFSAFASRVKRVNSLVTIFENQYQGGQRQLDFTVAGIDLLPIRNVFTINNCSIIRTWNGQISTGTNEVIVTENIEYKGLCDHVFNVPNW